MKEGPSEPPCRRRLQTAEHDQKLGGESPAEPDGGKRLEKRTGADREVRSEASAEQTREPMNKNRIGGLRCRGSWQMTTKPISLKGTGGKFGGCTRKAVDLTRELRGRSGNRDWGKRFLGVTGLPRN